MRATLVSLACLLRHLPLFLRTAPRTPLRVWGIIALDTVHVLRHSQPLPRRRIDELTWLLDFQGCVNAAWDRKRPCEAECQAIQRRLEKAGLGSCIQRYLDRLGELESRRPSIGGDRKHFGDVRSYREAVARLSLATAATLALSREDHEFENAAIGSTQCDSDLDTLFRILMQCQIMDDVLDYTEDLSAGLPSFLTATTSLSQALELTARAATSYDAPRDASSDGGVFPLRMALRVFTAVTRVVIRLADRHHRRTTIRAVTNEGF